MIHVLSRAIILKDDHLLMVFDPRENPVCYNLPGGHIEHQEGAQAALLRELQEEIGPGNYRIERYLGCLEHLFDPENTPTCHSHEYGFYFLVEADGLKIAPEQREPHIKPTWVPLDSLDQIDVLTPSFPKALKQWLQTL